MQRPDTQRLKCSAAQAVVSAPTACSAQHKELDLELRQCLSEERFKELAVCSCGTMCTPQYTAQDGAMHSTSGKCLSSQVVCHLLPGPLAADTRTGQDAHHNDRQEG